MPTELSTDSFADLVQRSRLVSADQMQQALQELDEEGTKIDSPRALADALIAKELLTRWQAGHLLKGKHNGFFLGSYRFLKMLGKGGMGAVYLAEHEMMRRQCAIKVLPSKLISDSSSVLERFYLEAQAVAALDDPNIVRAYDVNKEVQGKREIHYLVMEYVDGYDLQVTVQKKGPLGYVQVADFARQAASGLSHAHECGLIHRDIKPANLLLDSKGTVKILDLGLARFFDDRLEASLTTTHNESILGTADYLSPEQALDSHNVDTRTDIYSLGCTCYFMLTGHPPFPEGSVAQRLMAHQAKSPTAIEKLRPDVPVDLVTIVEKMIAKSADDRYQTSKEVAEAFAAWLAKHADDDWKEKHSEIFDSSASHARQAPTQARSAATEETDLRLALAPTDFIPGSSSSETDADLGLDQLESAVPSLATGSSSSGLDDLLSEALDNYPLLNSNSNLSAASSGHGTGSGIHGTAKGTGNAPTDANQIQLVKLILIGLAVSVPLAIVILVVSSRFAPSQADHADANLPAASPQPVPESNDRPILESPETTSPENPVAESTESEQTETPTEPESPNVIEPTTMTEGEPTIPTGKVPEVAEPATPQTPAAPSGTQPAAAPTSPPSANVNPTPVNTPNANPPTSSTAGDDNRDDKPDTVAAEPPSPEQLKKLLGKISVVTIKLDRDPKNAYDLMVLRTAQEALERAGLKVTSETDSPSSTVFTLSFDAEKAEQFFVFSMSA